MALQSRDVDEWPVLVVAAVGIVINGVTAWLFLAGSKGDLNIRAAFLHMAADALVSLEVVISAAAVLATGWMWIDLAISLLIVTMVVWGTWSLFAQSLHLLFDGVPHGGGPGCGARQTTLVARQDEGGAAGTATGSLSGVGASRSDDGRSGSAAASSVMHAEAARPWTLQVNRPEFHGGQLV